MPVELDLIKGSAKELTCLITGVPSGRALTKGRYMIKSSRTAPDNQAVLSLSITTGQSADGWIADAGADGKGELRFSLSDTALDAITPGLYWSVVKVAIGEGADEQWTEIPQSRRPTRILPAMINAVS